MWDIPNNFGADIHSIEKYQNRIVYLARVAFNIGQYIYSVFIVKKFIQNLEVTLQK
jgi:hypothetical protein